VPNKWVSMLKEERLFARTGFLPSLCQVRLVQDFIVRKVAMTNFDTYRVTPRLDGV